MFEIVPDPIDLAACRRAVESSAAGGFVAFEGWVRDHNEGRAVTSLEYEAYAALAVAEGRRILEEARQRFAVEHVGAVHRTGHLAVGDLAVWVGASAAHRDAAFAACRYVIDEVKRRVPIWKREHYADGTAEWVNCTGCAHGMNASADAGT
jgi:molybdopterin synthase catalytic subunit